MFRKFLGKCKIKFNVKTPSKAFLKSTGVTLVALACLTCFGCAVMKGTKVRNEFDNLDLPPAPAWNAPAPTPIPEYRPAKAVRGVSKIYTLEYVVR